MSDIRDVLQHRTTSLAQSLRNADEFNAPAAKSVVRRKRTVRAALTSSAVVVGVIAVGSAAWAGYGAFNQTPAVSPTPSSTPSVSSSPSPSPSPSATPAGPIVREANMTNERALELAAHPRTGEVWQEPEPYDPAGPVDLDADYWALAKVGTRGDSDIVAVAPTHADYFAQGAPLTALLEFDADGARVIVCPSANADALCSTVPSEGFLPDVPRDEATFYDSLTLPPTVEASGGIVVSTELAEPVGDASTWTGIVDQGDGAETWSHFASVDPDALIGDTDLLLVRTHGEGAVPGLDAFDYAIETPFGSYIKLPPEGIATLASEGFTWDDGATQDFAESAACESWLCAERWVAADARCFPFAMTLDPTHVASEWVAAGTMADGRAAYLPTPDNALARSIFTTMHDSSWDLETDAMNYPFATVEEFLAARSLVAFETGGNEWAVAIMPDAQNNPYECA